MSVYSVHRALLRDCFCCGLAGIFYSGGGLFAGLLGVVDCDLSALLGAEVGVYTALLDIFTGVLGPFDDRAVGPLDGVLGAVSGLHDECFGAFVDALHNAAKRVGYILCKGTLRPNCQGKGHKCCEKYTEPLCTKE